jgi:uncharacterized protein
MIIKRLRNIKFLLLKLLRINDSAHGIAIGFTVGVLINFVPSFGIGPILSALCAKLFKGNPFAGFVGGLASLWAFPLLFYLNIVVGEILLSVDTPKLEQMGQIFTGNSLIWKAFIVGMILNMLVFGSIIYFIIYYFVKKYRYDILMFIYKKWKI